MAKGLQIIRPEQRSTGTQQTPGMKREAAIAPETTGSESLWMGYVTSAAGSVTGWHHHGDCESGIYMLQGRARFSWGKNGSESAEVGPGDFIVVPPEIIHREETLEGEDATFIVARSCSEIIVVNVEGPEK